MQRFKLILIACLFFMAAMPALAGDAAKKSVEAVYKEKTQLSGKQVMVSGKVVKVNNGIMKRNFLHIQDGTGSEGSKDLIVTSKQTAKVGDKVEVVGTVKLDTDFGFGYAYPLLVENSTIKVAK